MAAVSILINVGAQTNSAVKNLDKVNKSLDEQKKAADKWKSGTSKAMKLGAAAIATAAAAAAAGLVILTREMIQMGREAVEDEQQARKLAQTLKNIGIPQSAIDQNEKWIASMELATLVSDETLRQAVGRLTAQTGDLALAQQEVALATDLSVGAGISYEKALKAIQTANDGSMESIGKYVDLQDLNNDGTIDLSESLKALEKAYGGSAKAAANNDPWKRLGVLWGNLREALGKWLIPLMDRLAEWFKNPTNQKKVQDFIDKMGDLSFQIGEEVVNALDDFYDWLQSPEGQRAMQDFKDVITDIKDALKSMKEWLDKNQGSIKAIGALIRIQTTNWKILAGAIKLAVGWLQTVWEWIKRVGGSSLLKLAVGAVGYSAASVRTAPLSAASARSGSTTNNVVNLYGSATPADARLVKRALEGYDVAQGRSAGTPLRVAW